MDYDMLCEKVREGAYQSKLPYPGVDTTEKLSDEEYQKMKKACSSGLTFPSRRSVLICIKISSLG